jgi:hypothetical protein
MLLPRARPTSLTVLLAPVPVLRAVGAKETASVGARSSDRQPGEIAYVDCKARAPAPIHFHRNVDADSDPRRTVDLPNAG